MQRWLAISLLAPVTAIGACGKDLEPLGGGGHAPAVDAAIMSDVPTGEHPDSGDGSDNGGGSGDGGGVTASCGSGTAVCEDFEAAAVGSVPGAPWTLSTPNCSGTGTLAVDATQAHTGAHSLIVHGGANFCDHVFLSSAAPASLHGMLYARFYVRFDDAFGSQHTTFLALADATDAKDLRMGGQSGIFMWNRELNDATLPALSPAGIALSVSPAPDAWHCVQIAIDQTAHTLQTSIDGVAKAGLVIDGTPTQDVDQQWLNGPAWKPSLSNIRFGWEAYGGTPMTLWYDDIAVGSAPIACL
jgi:hypothetical protein